MELSNTFEVKAPIEEAWTKLTDLELIAPAMPGAQLEEVEGDEYRGTVKVKVGPITAKYKGTAKIVDKDDDAKMVIIDAKGRDTRGQGNANATITAQLTEAGADVTKVELVTDLTLTGKVAQFARGVLSDVSTKLIGQFVDNLESDVFAGGDKASTAAAQPQDEADEAGPAATDKTAEAKDTTGKAGSAATDHRARRVGS
jgi:carbon monoxide dehydrogenase subunit G